MRILRLCLLLWVLMLLELLMRILLLILVLMMMLMIGVLINRRLNKLRQDYLVVAFLCPGKLLLLLLLLLHHFRLRLLQLLGQVLVAAGTLHCVVDMLQLWISVKGEVVHLVAEERNSKTC